MVVELFRNHFFCASVLLWGLNRLRVLAVRGGGAQQFGGSNIRMRLFLARKFTKYVKVGPENYTR